ncbi:hypothetical protein GPALN_003184 [Globodera pallida]|nr:hypothetical protein GPALN_003184 [Globodera pallida]
MANDNNANEQYLWMNDALGDDDGVGSDGERFSELIADTSHDRRPPDRAPSVVTLASRSSGGAGDSNNSNVSGTTSDGLSAIGRRIQQHPYPGEGARRLLEMVQQPFFVKFGDRGLSSAREIEHHRAGSSKPLTGSSTKPLISPFLKGVIFAISKGPAIPSALSRPVSPSARRSHSLSDYPPLYDFSRRPPSNVRTTPSIPDSVCRSSPTRRSHSLSDYPPLYDFSRRPQIRQGSLGSSYRNAAPDPNFHRRRYINSLLKGIRWNNDVVWKLEGRHEELDDACRRDAEELNIIRREREFLVRELELQSRELDMEEYERRRAAAANPKALRIVSTKRRAVLSPSRDGHSRDVRAHHCLHRGCEQQTSIGSENRSSSVLPTRPSSGTCSNGRVPSRQINTGVPPLHVVPLVVHQYTQNNSSIVNGGRNFGFELWIFHQARRTYAAQLRLFDESIAGHAGDERCERARTSIHESGHVFGLWFVEAAELIQVTIVPDEDSVGATAPTCVKRAPSKFKIPFDSVFGPKTYREFCAMRRDFDESLAGLSGRERYERARAAIHECGHLLALWHLEEAAEFFEITVVSDGETMGSVTSEGPELCSRRQLFTNIMEKVAGKIAEEIFFGDSDGTETDMEEALAYARQLASTREGVQSILDDAEQKMRDLLGTTDMKKDLLKVARRVFWEGTLQADQNPALPAGVKGTGRPQAPPHSPPVGLHRQSLRGQRRCRRQTED